MTPPSEPLYPVVQGTKICSRPACELAGKPQSISRFENNSQNKSGLHSQCKTCRNKFKRKWSREFAKKNPEIVRSTAQKHRASEAHKIWYTKNKEQLNAATKAWRIANPQEVRRLHIIKRFRQYGVTQEWYHRTLAEQGGKCAVCGSPDPKASFPTFHIDHDHNCCSKSCHACDKCRRGLLCAPCNTRLGILENKEWVAQAKRYLRRFK